MRRVRELIGAVRLAHPQDGFFADFEDSCRRNPAKQKAYRSYEDAFRWLDDESWQLLKRKALAHFRDHRLGQLKQGFFHQLNEALAYRHLVRQGFRNVRMLPEQGRRIPDIVYYADCERRHCEVKTIGISDNEIDRRGSDSGFSNVYIQLGGPFFRKLRSSIESARTQIASQGTPGLVYVILNFDDFALDNYRSYRREMAQFARVERVSDVFIKVGERFNRRMKMF